MKIHLAKLQLVSMKQEFGGLGIPNLHDLSVCLLRSWVKRFMIGEDWIWKNLLIQNTKILLLICSVVMLVELPIFWKGVVWVAKVVKFGYRWFLGNGKSIRFWEDCWFGASTLVVQYWGIYSICREQCKLQSKFGIRWSLSSPLGCVLMMP